MPREYRGDSTPEGSSIPRALVIRLPSITVCNRAGSAAARLNQSDIVFHFLDPVGTDENIARVWLCLMRGTPLPCGGQFRP